MQTPLQLDIWLQSYEEFVNAKNNLKQRNWNTVSANISKPISPTSDSFLLILSHISKCILGPFASVFLEKMYGYYRQICNVLSEEQLHIYRFLI